MKTFLTALILTFFVGQGAYSQDAGDSLKVIKQEQVQKTQREQNKQILIDENGNGIDDRQENKGKFGKRGNDKFIDKDGDGICDPRASGFGFRRSMGSTGKQPGKKHGPGGNR